MLNTPQIYATRPFTRREKTIIRQDVKHFEKIGRDHGCEFFEDYAEFVSERMKTDTDGVLTQKTVDYLRGLGSYFGDQLLRCSGFQRAALALPAMTKGNNYYAGLAQQYPGWLLLDVSINQQVMVPMLIVERIFSTESWTPPLDDIFEQLLDWNAGYLSITELETNAVSGPDVDTYEDWAV